MPAAAKNVLARATGRRKTSVARVRLVPGQGRMHINGKPGNEYFVTADQRRSAVQPLKLANADTKYDVLALVSGGGVQGQADALRLALARALMSLHADLESGLRDAGMLTRDARRKERKKYGQRGARARFQFSKR
ncbi:MAG: 30S ribosomal protein S9 [Planctomycetia bacterium]